MNVAIRQTIRDYLDQAEDREHTMRCFLGMLESGEATFADFASVDPAVANQLRAMCKKVVYYVATLARYVLVEAEDERQARKLGEAKLREMVGRDVPTVIRTVRPATQDEITLFEEDCDE